MATAFDTEVELAPEDAELLGEGKVMAKARKGATKHQKDKDLVEDVPPDFPLAVMPSIVTPHTHCLAFMARVKYLMSGDATMRLDGRLLIWRTYLDMMGEEAGEIPDQLAFDIAAYALQNRGYLECNLPVPDRALSRYQDLIQQRERIMERNELLAKIAKINGNLQKPDLNPQWKTRYQKELAELVKQVPGWKINEETGLAEKKVVPAANLKPKKSVSIKPGKKVKPERKRMSDAEKQAQYLAWEKAGGRRVTIPAHDEKVGNKVIHHKEYSYVLPPKG